MLARSMGPAVPALCAHCLRHAPVCVVAQYLLSQQHANDSRGVVLLQSSMQS
jgi:hypothetical protein